MDEKYVFKTLVMAGKTIDHCLGQCLQDCLCLSFQICHMTECQLCSSNKYKNSTELQSKKGCTNFVFGKQYPEVILRSLFRDKFLNILFTIHLGDSTDILKSTIHYSIKFQQVQTLARARALLTRARALFTRARALFTRARALFTRASYTLDIFDLIVTRKFDSIELYYSTLVFHHLFFRAEKQSTMRQKLHHTSQLLHDIQPLLQRWNLFPPR